MHQYLLATMFALLLTSTAWAGDVITLGTADDQDSPSSLTTNLFLTECFHRLNFKLVILPRPSKRSIFEADQGAVDGDFSRTEAVAKVYPNLIRVPEHISSEFLAAFSTDPGLKIDGWDSLLPYHVAWVNGREICKDHLGHAARTSTGSNETVLLRFLSEDRAQVGVLGLDKGRALLLRLNITNVYPLSPPLEKAKLYLYLNKKHQALVPEVACMLRKMKKDGTYEAIRKHFFEGAPYPKRLSTAQF